MRVPNLAHVSWPLFTESMHRTFRDQFSRNNGKILRYGAQILRAFFWQCLWITIGLF